MTSRERFLRIINGDMPDYIPAAYFIVDQGHFIAQMYPDTSPHNYDTLHDKMIELYRQLGGDILLRVCYGINPMYLQYGGLNVHRDPLHYGFEEDCPNYIPPGQTIKFTLSENWEIEARCEIAEKSITHISRVSTPGGALQQRFTATEILPGTYVYGCTEKPVKTLKDLKIAAAFEPGMDAEYPALVKEKIQRLKRKIGNDGIVSTWTPHGPFNIASLLVREEELYSLFLVEPDFYRNLMEFCISRTKDYASALSAAGVDAHSIGANVAGGFIGKKSFDEHILPFEKKYMNIVQSGGVPAIYHNCGAVMNLLESYIHVGPKIIEPFSPPPIGDGDIVKAKQILGGKAVIIGNLDQVNVLKPGPTDKIKEITEKTVLQGKQGGRFIFQTADFIEYDTPPEHIEVMIDAARTNGSM